MRIWLIELRRSAVLWAIAPVTIGWVWLTFSRPFMWLGSWPAASAWATAPVSYAVIILGALVGAEAARRRMSAPAAALRMSPRGWVALAPHLAAGLSLALVPLGVALVAVAARNTGVAPPGTLWPSYVLFATAVAITALCAAHLIGFAVPSVLIGALAGAVVGFIATAYAEIPLSAPPTMDIGPARLTLAVLLAVASTALAVVIPAAIATTTSSRVLSGRRVAAGLAAIGFVVAVVASPLVGPVQVARPAPSSPTCSTTAPRLCVWPEHAAYLPILTPVAQRIAQAANGLLAVPDELFQEGLTDSPEATNTFSWLARDAGLWHASEGMANAILNTTYQPRGCWPQSEVGWEQLRDLTAQLSYWLTARGFAADRPAEYHGSFRDTRRAKDALRLDDAAQNQWAAVVIQQIDEIPCAITPPES